jgi:hypothetical protein
VFGTVLDTIGLVGLPETAMGIFLLIGLLILGACLLVLPKLSEWHERTFGSPLRSWIFTYLDRRNKVIRLSEPESDPGKDEFSKGRR